LAPSTFRLSLGLSCHAAAAADIDIETGCVLLDCKLGGAAVSNAEKCSAALGFLPPRSANAISIQLSG
jgi:hypothetical protein